MQYKHSVSPCIHTTRLFVHRYGPFWVATTLVFVIAATGNYANYVSYKKKHSEATSTVQVWYSNVDKVTATPLHRLLVSCSASSPLGGLFGMLVAVLLAQQQLGPAVHLCCMMLADSTLPLTISAHTSAAAAAAETLLKKLRLAYILHQCSSYIDKYGAGQAIAVAGPSYHRTTTNGSRKIIIFAPCAVRTISKNDRFSP